MSSGLTITCLDVLTTSTSVGGANFQRGEAPVVSLDIEGTVATVRTMRGCGMAYRVDLDGKRLTAEDLGWAAEVAERYGDDIALSTIRLWRTWKKHGQPTDGTADIVARIAGEAGLLTWEGIIAAHHAAPYGSRYLPGPYTVAALALAEQG